ncbi:MAG: glycerophosphodiester phosphodiesterase [Solirubrobacterales bacterium]|nr:glycerophosphodiester phosphodiesterase [Solirubrobacterales bacterium]
MMLVTGILMILALTATAAATATSSPKARALAGPDGDALPLVIGHRGASAYRPEHTLAAYELAIELGADFIEPDLVSTKDGRLVARHENEISGTTNVADKPEFAGRRTTKTIDGVAYTGWFTEDFTLAELKTLRAKERIPALRPLNAVFDGLYEIPTLEEVIDLARREGVGVYPETKHPTYHDSIGLSLEEPLEAILEARRLNRPNAKVFVQSFETANLRELDERLRVPLVQLIGGSGAPADLVAAGEDTTYADLVTRAGLREISRYADGIGPDKNRIVPRDAGGNLETPTSVVSDAHRVGLLVHPYTFRPENANLPANLRRGDPASPEYQRARGATAAELRLFYLLGVDGVFSDHPDTAVAVRHRLFGP